MVVPSVTYETFGIIIIEAFSYGTPAIVHDLGSLPEVVEQSGGGFTYRSQDELRQQMDRLAADPRITPGTRRARTPGAYREMDTRAAPALVSTIHRRRSRQEADELSGACHVGQHSSQ